MEGWISLHRKFKKWEWYKNHTVKCLFIHLLLEANHKDGSYQGQEIKRGQLITGLHQLELETGLTFQQVRTALTKLKATNEITSKSTNKNRLITILKYNEYQEVNKQNNKQTTSKQQTNNKQITTNNNVNNENNVNKEDIIYRQFKHLSLSITDFNKLKLKFTKEQIDTILDNIENYKQNKKYTSLYLTANNWLRREKENKPEDIKSDWNPEEAIDKIGTANKGITVSNRRAYAKAHNLSLDSVMTKDNKIIQEWMESL